MIYELPATATPLTKPVTYLLPITQSSFNAVLTKASYLGAVNLGQLLTLELAGGATVQAVVQSIAGNNVAVMTKDLITAPVRRASVTEWWSLSSPAVRLFDIQQLVITPTNTGQATLRAYCRVLAGHKAGGLRWSLLYDRKAIVQGNDLKAPGMCFFELPNRQFKAGTYTLVARLVAATNQATLGLAQTMWTLTQPAQLLSCGGYGDVKDPLDLTITNAF